MPAALAAYGASLLRNPEVVLVKLLRTLFWSLMSLIGLAWYTGWRNERVPKGEITKWPIPGLSKLKPQFSASRDEAPLPTISDVGLSASGSIAGGTGAGGNASPGGLGNKIPPGGSAYNQIVFIGHQAQGKFGLHVGQHPVFGGVQRVHAAGSLHYQGRAIDVSGPEGTMQQFARWVKENYGKHITELIHNPGFSIKNGSEVPPSFWGPATWAAHRNHVHVGI